ncbi:MAG: LysR substrate-binding domain-containing protein [Corticimicrobacter sp.]|uniref:LysR family transcriptional regulator n=1 Tax=Corticimicrobacter populi TaxID=2175229 RepID=A0A2V1JZE7_9BURK|nr:LysR substrate-binding domain-containing protein [Corticimicrobacter populi]PWF21540.1 LysR family transcriptional regulator [Corticimicrobacter populi]QDQ88864.1 LysR family transcriptional regulator [Alcaligenaceae bacterium SJ-26]
MDKRITLRHLESFRAIMLCKTVTNAANMLHVSQPVVTRLIADLEERIGIQLFDRRKGRLYPTPEAALLYEEVQRSLAGIERITSSAAEIRSLQRGSIQIAAAPALALTFLPQAIASFIESRPYARILLLMHSSRTVMDMVQEERCDIGFVILSLQLQSTYGRLLMSTKMVCVVPATHRLAHKTVIVPTDLRGERYISHPYLLDTRTKIDSVFAAYGVSRVLHIETQTSYAMLQLVEAGAGVAIVDPLTASCYEGNGLRFIEFEPSITTNFSLLMAPDRVPSMLLQPFIDHVQAEMLRRIPPELVNRED